MSVVVVVVVSVRVRVRVRVRENPAQTPGGLIPASCPPQKARLVMLDTCNHRGIGVPMTKMSAGDGSITRDRAGTPRTAIFAAVSVFAVNSLYAPWARS